MLGYVTLGTNDLARAAKFYDALTAELGVGRMMENEAVHRLGRAWRRGHRPDQAVRRQAGDGRQWRHGGAQGQGQGAG